MERKGVDCKNRAIGRRGDIDRKRKRWKKCEMKEKKIEREETS